MSRNNGKIPVMMLVMCAVFAALMAVCAQIAIPFWPANICLTLFAVELCGALLKKQYAALATLAYILLGLVGVPVFTGFNGGAAVLLKSTGGYIVGYLFCAFLIAWLIERWGRDFWKQCLAMAVGVLVCYVFGTIWFIILTGRTLWESLGLCVIPYLPGDAVKIALAAFLSTRLYKPLSKVIH